MNIRQPLRLATRISHVCGTTLSFTTISRPRSYSPLPKHALVKLSLSSHFSRSFHITPPAKGPPAFLLIFKSTTGAASLRILSNFFLSFLPLALRSKRLSPRKRRILLGLSTIIPVTGFTLTLLSGLEQAPHTNRWRVSFMSEEEEYALCHEAFMREIANYTDRVVGQDRKDAMFVVHVAVNLVTGLDDKMNRLRNVSIKTNNNADIENENFGNVDINNENVGNGKNGDGINEVSKDLYPRKQTKELIKLKTNFKDNATDEASANHIDEARPFYIYVIDDDNIVNACAFGVTRRIIVYTGWLKFINYNEDYLATTLAHEMAHILQRHSSEFSGFSQVIVTVADAFRTVFWPFLVPLGPFINDYISSVAEGFVHSLFGPRYSQKQEREADLVGMQLLALAGYNPNKAVELWSLSAARSHNSAVTSNSNDIGFESTLVDEEDYANEVLKSLDSYFSTHPLDEERAKYLIAALPDAEELYERAVGERGRARQFKETEVVENWDVMNLVSDLWDRLTRKSFF